MSLITRFVSDESGATAIEYGLLAALIAVVIIGAVKAVGTNLSGKSPTSPTTSAKRLRRIVWLCALSAFGRQGFVRIGQAGAVWLECSNFRPRSMAEKYMT